MDIINLLLSIKHVKAVRKCNMPFKFVIATDRSQVMMFSLLNKISKHGFARIGSSAKVLIL